MTPEALYNTFFLYSEAKTYINTLLDTWEDEIAKTEERRKERKIDADIKSMRAEKKLAPDEFFIPDRVIDKNISREQPIFIQFLSQSKRLVIFKCSTNPDLDTQLLEMDVTDGFKYPGWMTQFFKVIDGAQTHGSDAMEVTFDETKPLHVAFEHVGHDNLYWDREIEDPQNSERQIRRYPVSIMQLENYAVDPRFGFNAEQVALIAAKFETPTKRGESINLYKVYFKFSGIVYVCWYVRDQNATDWIKAPEPLRLGISAPQQSPAPVVDTLAAEQAVTSQGGNQLAPTLAPPQPPVIVPQPIPLYPTFPYVYRESEEPKLTSKVGRSFLDKFTQECSTAIWSAFTTGLSRAANIYASPEQGDESEAALRQLDVTIESGKIYNKRVNFWNPPYPDALVLSALNALDVANSSQAGQTNFAAMNRKDTRKSATEMLMSQQTAEILKTVPISFYSEHLQLVFGFAWLIVQSQALQGKITLPRIGDLRTLALSYKVLPAGDVDFVQRTQDIVQMETDWPVMQNTGAAIPFLCDLVRLKYPEKGEEYAQMIIQGDPGKNLVKALSALLQGTLTPEEVKALPPAEQQGLQQIQQQVISYLGTTEQQPNQPQPQP